MTPSARSRAAAALVCVLVAVLSGCAADSGGAATGGADQDAQRFVAGDGSIEVVAPSEREPAVDVSGDTFTGGTLSLADYRGEVVVLNVWASWCAPCRVESPGLERVWSDVRSQGVQFVGVNVKDSEASARAFVRRFGISYPMVDDQPGRVPLAFGGTLPPAAIPSTLVLDRSGRVAARALGGVTESELRDVIDTVADGGPAAGQGRGG
ncbi:MAG: TlpA family protein disulfide reductase [Actinomycetes bacterium]